ARRLYPGLEEGWLVLADRNFYSWKGWCAAAGTGAALLWRGRGHPPPPRAGGGAGRAAGGGGGQAPPPPRPRRRPGARWPAGAGGEDLPGDQARYVRAIEYQVPDRAGNGKDERIILVTTVTDFRAAPAGELARAYHQRWEHEIGHRWCRSSYAGFSWLCSLF